jgi:hypothetical protein
MARPYGYRLDPARANGRHRIGGSSSDMAFTCGDSQGCPSGLCRYIPRLRSARHLPPAGTCVYAYMRSVVCIACRVQLRAAIFLALAASRICAAPNCLSLLDWWVMAWLQWPRAGHWLDRGRGPGCGVSDLGACLRANYTTATRQTAAITPYAPISPSPPSPARPAATAPFRPHPRGQPPVKITARSARRGARSGGPSLMRRRAVAAHAYRSAPGGRSRTSMRAASGPRAVRARSTVGSAAGEHTYSTRACRGGRPGTETSAAAQP